MQCEHCKKTISEDSIFCEHCGKKITKSMNKKNIKALKETPKLYKEILSHLEFLGYEVRDEDINNDSFGCSLKHKNRHNLYYRLNERAGVSFSVTYIVNKEKILDHKLEVLEAVNQLNTISTLTTYAFSNEFDAVHCFAWFPLYYSKSLLANFIELMEGDINRLLSNETLRKYY